MLRKQRADAKKETFRERLVQKKLTDRWLMIQKREKENLGAQRKRSGDWNLKKQRRWRKKEKGGKVTEEEVNKVERVQRKREIE